MMPFNSLQLDGLATVERTSAVGSATPADGGFVKELAAQVEKETGEHIDPQALAAWLNEHNDDYPAIAPEGLLPLLAQLMDRPAAASLAAHAPGAGLGKDPAALLESLTAASGKPVRSVSEAGGQAVRMLSAALRAGGQEEPPPLPEQATAGSSAPAAFQHLLQSAAVAVPGGSVLPVSEDRAGGPPLQVTTPVTQAGFGEAVGGRLLWMVQHEVHHARMQLNPPELGPLDITVSLQDDRISIAVNAHHALTREALTADAPRLRGLLADAGFSAVDVNVSHDQGRGDHPPPGHASYGFTPAGVSAATEPAERAPSEGPMRRGSSLVDHYA